MTDHNLMPKHGEMLILSENDADIKIKEICKMQRLASVDLASILDLAVTDGKQVRFPCKQCVLDVSLQFRDLSEILKGLVDGK